MITMSNCKKTLLKYRIFLISIFISFSIMGFSFIGINLYYIHLGNQYGYDDIKDVPERKVALVLGCRPGSLLLYWRLEAALNLYLQDKVKKIIVSGDNGNKQYNEPEYMKQCLVKMGVKKEDIFCDYAGFRTLDSIVRAEKIFSQDDFIIVSQKWHNSRALSIAYANNMSKVIAFHAKTCRFYRYLPEPPRESIARVVSFVDLYIINRKPKFYGEKIDISL